MKSNAERGLWAVGCGLVATVGMLVAGCSSAVDSQSTIDEPAASDSTASLVGATLPETTQGKVGIVRPNILQPKRTELREGVTDKLARNFGPLSCPIQQTTCGDSCVTLATDNQHCGACGVACNDGEKCSNGQCGATCGEGTLACGDSCIDPQTSQTNCGATDACDADAGTSGDVCGTDEACVQGECYSLRPYLVGSIRVSDGPKKGDPKQLGFSCIQACANQYGDEPKDYHCSTSAESLDNKAWGSSWGSNETCLGGVPGNPIDEDFGTIGYANPGDVSTFIDDECDQTSVNFCWRVPPSDHPQK